MLALAELPPITDERRLIVANWVETNIRPVLQMAAQAAPAESGGPEEFELRDYQIDAWVNLEAAREVGRIRALGNLATGLGKTFIAAVDVLRFTEMYTAEHPARTPRILYASHRRGINRQAAKTFRLVMPHTPIDSFRTHKKQLPGAGITFAMLPGLHNEFRRFYPEHFDYIVWDESHHLEAATYKRVRDYFRPLFEHAITASLNRSDGKDIQVYFGPPLYQKTLPVAIAEGHLADVDYRVVFDTAIKSQLLEAFKPRSFADIKRLFDDKPPSAAIARSIEEEVERLGLKNPKIMAFCATIEEADEMAEHLGGMTYHSQTKDPEQVLQDFRSGKLRTITARDMLNEGIDVPDAEVIVFLRGTNSENIFEQQLGRGLRRTKHKTKVYVLDYVGNIERILRVRRLQAAVLEAVRSGISASGQGGEGNGAASGDVLDQGALRVHTQHADFNFDKMVIDLVEKLEQVEQQMSKKSLVALALELSPDAPISYNRMRELASAGDFAAPTTIARKFDSIPAFHEECGFPGRPRSKVDGMTNKQLVEWAKEIKPSGPLTPYEIRQLSARELFASLATIVRRFDSPSNFQQECGFEPTIDTRRKFTEMSNMQIVNLALEISPDAPLDKNKILALPKGRFPRLNFINRRFVTLANFQIACGFEPTDKRKKRGQ